MQLKYHSPLGPSAPEPTYHPIFYRVKERLPGSPISPMSEFPPDIEWETRFVKCSYAMVSNLNCGRSHGGTTVLMTVCGPLFLLGIILLPAHQTHHHPLLYDPHRGPSSRLLCPSLPNAYIPTRTPSLG
jgi:hypothetical protein